MTQQLISLSVEFQQVDENHRIFPFLYLRDKLVSSFNGSDYMLLHQAESDGLITFEITMDNTREPEAGEHALQTYFEEIKSLYHMVCSQLLWLVQCLFLDSCFGKDSSFVRKLMTRLFLPG